mgnify:CR=1 FL=1
MHRRGSGAGSCQAYAWVDPGIGDVDDEVRDQDADDDQERAPDDVHGADVFAQPRERVREPRDAEPGQDERAKVQAMLERHGLLSGAPTG